METKTIITFFVIMLLMVAEWMLLTEFTGLGSFIAALISVGTGCASFYLYQKLK